MFRNESLFQKFLSILLPQHNHKFTKCVMRKFTHSSQQSNIKFIKIDEPSSIVQYWHQWPIQALVGVLVDVPCSCRFNTLLLHHQWKWKNGFSSLCQEINVNFFTLAARVVCWGHPSAHWRERDLIIIGSVALLTNYKTQSWKHPIDVFQLEFQKLKKKKRITIDRKSVV